MKRSFSLLAAACLTLLPLAAAQSRLPLLPGWHVAARPALASPAGQLPPSEAAIMAEFGLRSVQQATASRGAATVAITAYRFGDSDGAYGAFTLLRHPGFHAVALANGVLAASGGRRILLTRARWVMLITAAQPRYATAAARPMARALEPAVGGPILLPTVAYQLPPQGLQPGSRRYAEGPLAFAAACSWLPPALVGFDRSAEVATGEYANHVAVAVISYPTPQIATAHFAALAAVPGVQARRSASLIALVHGADAAAAAPLLATVRYEANFTLVPPTPVGIEALPALILSIFLLCGLLIGVALVLGVLTGGARILLNRILPRRFHRLEQENLIQLHLRENLAGASVSQRK